MLYKKTKTERNEVLWKVIDKHTIHKHTKSFKPFLPSFMDLVFSQKDTEKSVLFQYLFEVTAVMHLPVNPNSLFPL